MPRFYDEATREDDGLLAVMCAEMDHDETTHERFSSALVDLTFGKTEDELMAFAGITRQRAKNILALARAEIGRC